MGRSIRLDFSRTPQIRQRQPPSPILFVGNLPTDVTEADIRAVFEGLSGIENIKLSQLFVLNPLRCFLITFFPGRIFTGETILWVGEVGVY